MESYQNLVQQKVLKANEGLDMDKFYKKFNFVYESQKISLIGWTKSFVVLWVTPLWSVIRKDLTNLSKT